MLLEITVLEINTILKGLAKLPLEECFEIWKGLQDRANAALAKEQEDAKNKEEPVAKSNPAS